MGTQTTLSVAMELEGSASPAFSKNNGSLGEPMGPAFDANGSQPQPREILVGADDNKILERSMTPPDMAANRGTFGQPMGPSFDASGSQPEPREIVVGAEGGQLLERSRAPRDVVPHAVPLGEPFGPSFETEGSNPQPRETVVGPACASPVPPAFAKNNGSLGSPMGPSF